MLHRIEHRRAKATAKAARLHLGNRADQPLSHLDLDWPQKLARRAWRERVTPGAETEVLRSNVATRGDLRPARSSKLMLNLLI